jgi:phosphatidate phosphatase PAH1
MKILNHDQHGQCFLKLNYFSKISFSEKNDEEFNFRIDYIKATELLDRLPTVSELELPDVVEFVISIPYFFQNLFF